MTKNTSLLERNALPRQDLRAPTTLSFTIIFVLMMALTAEDVVFHVYSFRF